MGGKYFHVQVIYLESLAIPFNSFTLSGLFYHNFLDSSLSNSKGVCLILLLLYYIEIPDLMQTV